MTGGAVHDDAQMGLDRDWNRPGRGEGELNAAEIDSGRWPLDLAELNVLDKEGGDDVHHRNVQVFRHRPDSRPVLLRNGSERGGDADTRGHSRGGGAMLR